MVCDFSNVAFYVFGFPIHWYSLAYIFGIIFALKLTEFLIKKVQPEIDVKILDEFVGTIVFGIIIGGRLGHVLFYDFDFYQMNPIEIFKIWKGGMSFFGGFLGIAFAAFLFCKKHKINFFRFMDLWSVSVPIGLFFGRIANFVNGELLGKPCAGLAWGVIFKDGVLRHPSQLYEAFLEGILLFATMVFHFWLGAYKFEGRLCGIFCLGYGINRFLGECFREPDSLFSWNLFFKTGLNLNQYFCLGLIFLGVFLVFRSVKNDADSVTKISNGI